MNEPFRNPTRRWFVRAALVYLNTAQTTRCKHSWSLSSCPSDELTMPSKSMEELEEMVGESVTSIEGFEVEAGKVAEFARATSEDNEVFYDETAARKQGFDSIPAPLTFTRTAYFPRYRPDGVEEILPFDLGFRDGDTLHGEQKYEFHRPLTVGDTLTGTTTLTDIYQRDGSRGGQMTFAVFEIAYRDQNDERVITERSTLIETGDINTESGDTE